MRLACFLVVAAGCGRLGFDGERAAGGDAARADAPIDAPIDAPPCTRSCLLGDSMADFAVTQGSNGWWYGYYDQTTDADGVYDYAADFQPLTYVTADGVWRPPTYNSDPTSADFTWCYVARWGGHPNGTPREFPIRRWVSAVAGPIRITALHAKADTGGDGTRAILKLDGATLWTHDVAGTDRVGVTATIDADVVPGSTLDFLLDAIGDDAFDTTDHGMTIDRR